MLAAFDPDYDAPSTDHDANVRKAERIVAKAGTMVANGYRIQNGKEPLEPKPEHTTAQNFLYLMLGEEADPKTVELLDASLTLYAEHTFNASTFACRVMRRHALATSTAASSPASGPCAGPCTAARTRRR